MTESRDAAVPFTARDFRTTLGRFPTGVVVVAAVVDSSPAGLAVNSFTSVSLDPPLVAFCVDRGSSTWPAIRRAGGFTVSILAAGQDDLCMTFASKGADRFAGVQWSAGSGGHPRIEGAVAWLDCSIHRVDEAGDHQIVLGEVHDLVLHDRPSLLFHGGRFADLVTRPSAEQPEKSRPAEVALAGLHGLDVATPFFDVLSARLDRN
ncbi:flavin reductase family protein [Micromonospora marina]|uniref:flavin reductase family protein n=1 Tax=Micromonospora marina TaxID=307120 RepID=UPI003455D281